MRKSFTRLFGLFLLFVSLISFQVVAQGATFDKTGLSPGDGVCDASRSGDFVISFASGKVVYPNAGGVFAINNTNGTELITMNIPANPGMEITGVRNLHNSVVNWRITFSSNKITINFGNYELLANTAYYITVSEDAVKDASGNFFKGLKENGTSAMVACANNNPQDWDFTTVREGILRVTAFDPADNSNNVSVQKGKFGGATFSVTFDRPVFWAATSTSGTINLSSPPSWLKDGYFALYSSTDGQNGEYGGDVVSHILGSLSITNNVLTFTFVDGYDLDANAAYYLRVRPDIIEDQYGNLWDGVNTNTEWNWTTKDGAPAKVETIAWYDATCVKQKGDIVVTFSDGYTSGSSFISTPASVYVVSNPNSSPAAKTLLDNSNKSLIKEFITFSGGDFDVKSVSLLNSGASNQKVVVTITPKTNMTSNTKYTVTVNNTSGVKQLWDASNELITGKSTELTSKDYDAPVTTNTITTNPDGSTFDILGRLNEPGDIYYIVVADSAWKVGTTSYTEFDLIRDNNRANIYTIANGDQTGWKTLNINAASTPATDDIFIWASGKIKVDDKNLTYHERITGLPKSHGQYYSVIFFAADRACSGANSIGSGLDANLNVSSIDNRIQAVLDILPPYVFFWKARYADPNEAPTDLQRKDGCTDLDTDGISGIHRNGPIIVEMNEAVENAFGWGSDIKPSDIPGIFSVFDHGVPVALDVTKSKYVEVTSDPDISKHKFYFELYPKLAFQSGNVDSTVQVVLNPGKIQDSQDNPDFGVNGTEKLNVAYAYFCVEYYAGPVAICDATMPNFWTPADSTVNVDEDKVITFVWDQYLYAPAADESTPGVAEAISNTIGDRTWVGNYVRILSGSSYTAARTGQIIHQSTSPNYEMFDFKFENKTVKVNNVDKTFAIVTVSLKPGKVYDSETWYYFEVEPGLQTIERYTLEWDGVDSPNYSGCAPHNYWMAFKSEDNRHPVCIFYEDNDLVPNVDLGILDGKEDVNEASYIKVEIDEWVSLGFDGWKNLEATDTIEDANALRPYFTLQDPSGAYLRFDVKNFFLSYGGDVATFYIDPYELVPGTTKETPNFIIGKDGYKVCFLGDASILNPNYNGGNYEEYAGDSTLYDDNKNGVGRACAEFDIYEAPATPSCLVSATLNTKTLDITNPIVPIDIMLASDSTLVIDFNFGGPMAGVTGHTVSIYSGATEIATVDAGNYINKGQDGRTVSYTFDMHGVPQWVNDADFSIRINTTGAMVSTATDYSCSYPSAVNTTVSTFHTIDGTAPRITAFIPDLPSYGGCLVDKDATDIIVTFDEIVRKQPGKLLEIWRFIAPATNTLIASVDVANGTYRKVGNVTDSTTLIFETGTLYNGNSQEICDKLVYGGSYFVQMPQGFVKNEVGLANAAVTGRDSLSFCIGPDPAPYIDACTTGVDGDKEEVAPYGANSSNPKPIFQIKFSEPVQPVVGKKIQVSDNITTNAVFGFDVSLMTTTDGGITYTLNSEDWLPINGYPSFKNFVWGNCYYVNVDSAAFVDKNNALLHTNKIVSFTTQAEPVLSTCTWWFCMNDTQGPTVKLWPNNNDVSIPVNAHLYAYINDVPWVNTGGGSLLPLVTGGYTPAEAQQFFSLSWVKGVNSGTLTNNQWKLEFVGVDKQHLRISVYDPAGYDFSPSSVGHPVMQAEAVYTLAFNPTVSGRTLCDSIGNAAAGVTASFTTEDITDPVFVVGASGDSTRTLDCGTKAKEMNLRVVLNEKGTVRYEVWRGTSKIHEGGPFDVNFAAGVNWKVKNDIKITLPVDPKEGEYNVQIRLFALDDEKDLYKTDEQCAATWMWSTPTADYYYDGESYDRIRDFLWNPRPEVQKNFNCSLCDDDKPIIDWAKSYPKDWVGGTTQFPLGDSIRLYFNETVQLTDATGPQGQGYTIWLRDYENNLGVPMAYQVVSQGTGMTNNVIVLYPLDSTSATVKSLANQFQPYTGTNIRKILASERKYYIEIDRYAVSDDGGCSGVNYFDEVTGKGKWFKTKDATAPCLAKVEPLNTDPANLCGVSKDADIRLTFTETSTFIQNVLANVDSNYVYIYRLGNYPVPHERLPISRANIQRASNSTWTVDLETTIPFRSSESYIVRIPFGTFKDDPYGNKWMGCSTATGVSIDAQGAYWTFTVEDYLAPVPAWTVFSHQDYLDVVLDDQQYDMTVKSGVKGESYNKYDNDLDGVAQEDGIPTSSFLKIEFDEEVFIKNTDIATPATFKTLAQVWNNGANDWNFMDDLYDMVNIKVKASNGSTWTNLVKPTFKTAAPKDIDWTKPYEFRIDSVSDNSRAIYVTIYQASAQWSPVFTTEVVYGLKSKSDYQVDLAGGFVFDDELCDGSRLVMGNIDNLVTMVTRDDIPPTLKFYDGTDLVSSEIKGKGMSQSINLVKCVDKDGPLTLQFDGRVVKTPYAGIGYDPLGGGWTNNNINWYTEANLPLKKTDLINPNSSNVFLQVYRLGGVTLGASTTTPKWIFNYSSKVSVGLKDVKIYEVDGKTTIDLEWLNELVDTAYYQVVFLGGTVKDTKRIPNGNIFLGDSVVFRVEDYKAPEVVALKPANDPNKAATITPPTGLWIQYNQAIKRGSGTLEVRWMNGQQNVTVEASACQTVESNTAIADVDTNNDDNWYLYIPLNTTLDDFESYYVIVPEGFVTDVNECYNPDGLKSATINEDNNGFKQWVFHTADKTPPIAELYIPNSIRDAAGNVIAVNDSVPTGSDLSIIFDENVKIGACANGGLFIYHNDLLDGFQKGTDFGNFIEFIPFNDPTIEISGSDYYNENLERNVVTFNPKTTFEKKGIYYIRVSEAAANCGILDDANNGWNSKKVNPTTGDPRFANDTIQWSFVVSNDVAPMLASTDPAYDHDNNPNIYAPCFVADEHGFVLADLSMTFTDNGLPNGTPVPVAPREGFIEIYEYRYDPVTFEKTEKLWTKIDINNSDMVHFSGNNVTITGVKLRDNIQNEVAKNKHEFYYVNIGRGVIINAYPGSTTFFAGIKDAFTWRFKTCADTKFVDGYEILSPTIQEDGDAAKNLVIQPTEGLVGPYANTLIVEFNEGIEVFKGTPKGLLTVYNMTDKKVAQQIDITDATIASGKVKIEGKKLTVVTDSLKDEKQYYVEIAKNAIGDTATVSNGNDYIIGGQTKWTFTTGDNTKPAPKSFGPVNNATCQKDEVVLSFEFTENFGVTLNQGVVEVKNAAGSVIITKTIADATVSATNPNIVTIPVKNLPDSTDLTVNVPAGFVVDNGNNHLANNAFSWTFRTAENTKPTIVDFKPNVVVGASQATIVLTFSEVVKSVKDVNVTVGHDEHVISVPADSFKVDAENAKVFSAVVSGLHSEAEYTVNVAAGAFEDVNVGCDANKIEAVSFKFTVGDILPPTATYTPDGITLPDYAPSVTLTINFNDMVSKVAGKKIKVYNAVTNEVKMTIDADSFNPAEGNKTYSYAAANLGYGSFYVLVDAGAFVDNDAQAIGKPYAGIADVAEWTFSIVDASFDCANPEIIAPTRGANGIPTTTTISIQFCTERIKAGVGFVTVGDQDPEQIEGKNYWNFSEKDFIIEGSKLTINVAGLKEMTTYSIIIAPGAIIDEAGNKFGGIIDANKWWFTTGDFTNPIVTVENINVNNVNGVVPVSSNELGTVYIAKSDVPAKQADIVAAIAQGKAKQAPVVAVNTAVNFSAAGLVAGKYYAYAIDENGNFGTSANSFEVTDVPMLSIKAIQGEKDATPYEGKLVATKGVVTAVTADKKGYFIQDANEAWGGIYVFDAGLKANIALSGNIQIGTSIKIVGTASEYYNLTEIKDIVSVELYPASVNPEPIVLANIADVKLEKYEGVLTQIKGVEINALPDTNKEWKVARPSTSVVIIDDQFYPYTPVQGHHYDITGVVNYTYENYKIEPRKAEDIKDLTVLGSEDLATAIKVYPNPFDKFIKLEVSSNVTIAKAVITNIAGQTIKEVINPEYTIPTSELRSGVYFISLHTVDGIAKTERIIKR